MSNVRDIRPCPPPTPEVGSGAPVYRTAPPGCRRCGELEARLAAYEAAKLWPHQSFSKNPQCIACGDQLYKEGDKGGFQKKRPDVAGDDETFCEGRQVVVGGAFWWRKRVWACPPKPHLHRHCGWCGARWLEEMSVKT